MHPLAADQDAVFAVVLRRARDTDLVDVRALDGHACSLGHGRRQPRLPRPMRPFRRSCRDSARRANRRADRAPPKSVNLSAVLPAPSPCRARRPPPSASHAARHHRPDRRERRDLPAAVAAAGPRGAVRAVAARRVADRPAGGLRAMAARHLRVPARRPVAHRVQHVRAVHVRRPDRARLRQPALPRSITSSASCPRR